MKVPVTSAERLAFVVPLAGAGAMVGHALGYGSAGIWSPEGHAHLGLLGPALMLVGGVALAVGAVRSLRRRGLRPATGELLAAQVALYTLLEVAEHTTGALPVGGLLSGPVLLGIVAQLPVSWLLSRLFDVTVEVVARIAGDVSCRVPGVRPQRTPIPLLVGAGRRLTRPGPPRGPPSPS